MTSAERAALGDITGLAAARRVRLTRHAREQAGRRGVQVEDVFYALRVASTCSREPAEPGRDERWRVPSKDLEGDALTLIVFIDDGVVVITVHE